MSDFEVRRIAWRESCQASFAVDTEDVEGATAKALLGSLCSCWMEHFLGCAPCRRPSGCKRCFAILQNGLSVLGSRWGGQPALRSL